MATRTVDALRRGARIHSLMRAVYLARSRERPFDVTWERLNYRRTDADGVRGTVCFSKAGAVGLFFRPSSPGAPANRQKPYVLEAHFEGAPEPLMQHARREGFPTMDLEGRTVVTAAFWSDKDGALVGARPWARLAADGASLVDGELQRPEKAIAGWASQYGLSGAQADVVIRLFGSQAKLPASNARVVISAEDRTALGLVTHQVARELLEGAGIALA